MAPRKSLGVSPLSVLVVTFLKNCAEVCPLAAAAWLCTPDGLWAAAVTAAASTVTTIRRRNFIGYLPLPFQTESYCPDGWAGFANFAASIETLGWISWSV